MAFIKTEDVAQHHETNWSNFIKTVQNCTPESAQRIAMCDPEITFFFYCRQHIALEGKGAFKPGDAVFFSGKPWPGSAPQCDIYRKDFFNVAYVEVKSNSFANVGRYALQDGRQLFDIACIFAAHINCDDKANKPVLFFSPQVSYVLNNTNDVKTLQDLGITVLLTVAGNYENAGWSCFTYEAAAMDLAEQLADAVNKYGLDGIDIDDEYSICTPNDTSLIMVTSAMRQFMPDKIISKALFTDTRYFNATWEGLKLVDNLSYGWEISYWNPNADSRLRPYLDAGMQKKKLGLGVATNSTQTFTAKEITQFVKDNGFGGMVIYNVTKDSQDYLSMISQALTNENVIAKQDFLVENFNPDFSGFPLINGNSKR